VRTLNRVVSGIFDDRLRPFGIRSSQINILTVVAARGPLAPVDVCRTLRLERSTLSRDLNRLIERGWIASSPGPGRGLRLEVTDIGKDLLRAVKPAWDEAQSRAEEVLGPALVEAIRRAEQDGRLGG
jgi:DNA-binding MarR family transcriptional regulator